MHGNALAVARSDTHEHVDVILQIPSDALQLMTQFNPVPGQFTARSNSGKHQQLRRVKRAAAEYNFAPGTDLSQPLRAPIFDTGGTAALEQHTRDVRSAADSQVGPKRRGFEIGTRIATARAVLLINIVVAHAFLFTAVEVRVAPVARLHRRLDERRAQRVGIAALGNIKRTTPTMKRRFKSRQLRLEMFGSSEVRQHIGIRPPLATEPCPLVVVPGMSANVDLRVHAAGPADHLTPWLIQGTAIHVLLRLGIELPVDATTENQLQKAQRHIHERIAAALRTGLKQQHRMAAAFG